jgi:hypothetical protein
MSPLTRVDALVAAAILDHDPERVPSWDGIAARLRDWAHIQPQTEHEEGEMPSQSTDNGPKRGTLEAVDEAVPGVQKHPRDLTASPRPTEAGDEQL